MIPPLWNYCRIVPVIRLFSATFPPYGITSDFINRGQANRMKICFGQWRLSKIQGKVILLWCIIQLCEIMNFSLIRWNRFEEEKNIIRLFFFSYKYFSYVIVILIKLFENYLRNFHLLNILCSELSSFEDSRFK